MLTSVPFIKVHILRSILWIESQMNRSIHPRMVYFETVEGDGAAGDCGSGALFGMDRAKVRPIEKMIRNWAVGITLSRRSRVRGWL